MSEYIYTGADDGKNDTIKIENTPEAWGNQVQWDFELSGLLPLAAEPKQHKEHRIVTFLKWLGSILIVVEGNNGR
jgi:hypothetical protein